VINFGPPVASFGAYFTYVVPLTMTAFDSGNNPVAQAFSQFNNNLACLAGPPCFGDVGSAPNEFIQVAFAGGVSGVTIVGDPSGFSLAMDEPAAVPEPSSLWHILIGSILILGLRQLTKCL